MRRCQICKVPLDGFLGKIAKRLFKVEASGYNPGICNKCSDKKSSSPAPTYKKGKYRCQICEREIDENVAISHIKAEEYIIELIRKDHPEWKEDRTTCHKCIDYYRRLVKDTEI